MGVGADVSRAEVDGLRAALLAGGVALVPTDTVYGLAAALDVPAGVEALYALKGRPREQPCQVLMYATSLLDEALARLDEPTRRAVRALLPGQATCIVPDPEGRYTAASGAEPGSVGLRMPRMEGPIAGLDIPLVATSANDPGGPDPATIADVPERVRASVAVAVNAGMLTPTPSAVVDLRDRSARIVRVGSDPGGVEGALRRVGVPIAR